MSKNTMYSQMGVKAAGAVLDYAMDSMDAKMQRITQAYGNKMQALSTAQSLNGLTASEISVRDAANRSSMTIQLQSLADKGSLAVGAAAAGVKGGSVNSASRGLERSKLNAKGALRTRLVQQGSQNAQQRRNILMGAAFSKDISVIAQPSAAAALMGLGAGLIETYDEHQPEGQKFADTSFGWGKRRNT